MLHIISDYNALRENPELDLVPKTYIFAAKAAAGYDMAKGGPSNSSVSWPKRSASSPKIREKLNVVFLENYNVTMSETLMPASEISEQISLAGKEASGTGNMKFMINGALTIGTLDGANVEMHERVGDDNIFIFGLTAEEVSDVWNKGYSLECVLQSEPEYAQGHRVAHRRVQTEIPLSEIANYLLHRASRCRSVYVSCGF